MSDNLDGLTSMLPILRTGECIVLGEAVKLPMRTLVIPPPKDADLIVKTLLYMIFSHRMNQ
jgi:hypothetical protein